MDPKRPRKGRPLLLASVGVAAISFVACNEPRPVGNLRAPDPKPEQQPVGNLRGPEPMPIVDAGPEPQPQTPPDAGAKADAASALLPVNPPSHPVGNLKPPPPPPPPPSPPVGNLRAPPPAPKK